MATSASHIQGLTLAGCFVDEAVVSDQEGFTQLLGRCSEDGSKIFCSCNPESPHHWFYTEYIRQARRKNILYIHFTMDDNPSLSEEIKQEYKRMFSGVWAERFIEGKWVVATGLIYDMWKDEQHIIDFNDIPFNEAVKWCVGVDFGTANPTTFQLMFKSYTGKIYVVDEYYHAGGKITSDDGDESFDNIVGYENQKTDLEYANDLKWFLKELNPFTGLRWRDIEIVIDPAAASFSLQLRKLQFKVRSANNAVLDGIRTVSTYMGNNQFFVSNKCSHLISELHGYSWDEKSQIKGYFWVK